MKFFSKGESESWLQPLRVQINGIGHLLFAEGNPKVMTTMPREPFFLNRLANTIGEWISVDAPCLLWLAYWETTSSHQMSIFEKIRLSFGETRHLIDAPGHLFESFDEQEKALMTGLIFLIMAFNWEAYIVSQDHAQFIYFGDEHIVFSSENCDKMKEVAGFMADCKIKQIEDIRQAWT